MIVEWNEWKQSTYPEVTHILNVIDKGLTGWANWVGRNKKRSMKEIMQEAMNIGSLTHNMIDFTEKMFLQNEAVLGVTAHDMHELYIASQQMANPEYKHRYSEDEINIAIHCFNQFLIWRKKKDIKPFKTEAPVINVPEIDGIARGYKGVIDGLYEKEDGSLILLDYKTSKKVYSSYFSQLGAYYLALPAEIQDKVNEFQIVRFSKENTTIEIQSTQDIEPFSNRFLDLTHIYYSNKEIETHFKTVEREVL